MTEMASTAPLRLHLGAMASFALNLFNRGLKRLLKYFGAKIMGSFGSLRPDGTGFEGSPLDPVSRFYEFELDVWTAKQSPEALQFRLVR